MIERANLYKDIVNIITASDKKLRGFAITEEEWRLLRDWEDLFKVC